MSGFIQEPEEGQVTYQWAEVNRLIATGKAEIAHGEDGISMNEISLEM